MPHSRRKFLGGVGAATAIGLAGCAGQSGDGGGGSDGEGGSGSGGTTGTSSGSSTDYKTNVKIAGIDRYGDNDDGYVDRNQDTIAKLIEEKTDGELSVQMFPQGEIGGEAGLQEKVQQGSVEIGSSSFQNFTPYAGVWEVSMMPFLHGKVQQQVNLLTSDAWREVVYPEVRRSGFEILSYTLHGSRNMAYGVRWADKQPPLTPAAIREQRIKHRTSLSSMTATAFEQLGVNPTPIEWAETVQAMEEGVVDSTYNSFPWHMWGGFQDMLAHEISVNAQPDIGVWTMNGEWFKSLPDNLQSAVKEAGREAFHQSIEEDYEKYTTRAYEDMKDKVRFISLTDSQREKWRQAMGYQNNKDVYGKFLVHIGQDGFDKLWEAARTKGDFSVPEFEDIVDYEVIET